MVPEPQLCLIQMSHLSACKMSQWIKVLPAKSEDPSLISGTQMVEGENQTIQVVL